MTQIVEEIRKAMLESNYDFRLRSRGFKADVRHRREALADVSW